MTAQQTQIDHKYLQRNPLERAKTPKASLFNRQSKKRRIICKILYFSVFTSVTIIYFFYHSIFIEFS